MLWYLPRYTDYLGSVVQDHLPRVELVPMTIGVDAATLVAVLDTRPEGIVIEGFGGGHVRPQLLDAIDQARLFGIPAVVASRCGYGPTLQETYAVPGCEKDLRRRGAIMAGALSARKARLRLAVAIANEIPVNVALPVI